MTEEQLQKDRERQKLYMREKRKANPQAHRDTVRKCVHKLKKETFDAYGNICACCGLTDIRFLSIDHINNDGAKHRAEIGCSRSGGNSQICRWLRKNGYPKDNFQLLCYNCNFAKQTHGGTCPHKITKKEDYAHA